MLAHCIVALVGAYCIILSSRYERHWSYSLYRLVKLAPHRRFYQNLIYISLPIFYILHYKRSYISIFYGSLRLDKRYTFNMFEIWGEKWAKEKMRRQDSAKPASRQRHYSAKPAPRQHHVKLRKTTAEKRWRTLKSLPLTSAAACWITVSALLSNWWSNRRTDRAIGR